jgi:hypothetical protein
MNDTTTFHDLFTNFSPHWPSDAGEVAEYDALLAEFHAQVEDQEA